MGLLAKICCIRFCEVLSRHSTDLEKGLANVRTKFRARNTHYSRKASIARQEG